MNLVKMNLLKNTKSGETIIRDGAILMALAVAGTGLGISIYERRLDHLERPEDCLLCKIEPTHMAAAINRDHSDEYVANYIEGTPEKIVETRIKADEIVLEDGSIVYTVPEGYTLDGDVGKKTVYHPATIDRTEVRDKETNELVRILK